MALIQNWTDGGLDWDNPVPEDARYMDAIVRALNERCVKVGRTTLLANYTGSFKYCKVADANTIYQKLLEAMPYFANTNCLGTGKMFFKFGTLVPDTITGFSTEANGWYGLPIDGSVTGEIRKTYGDGVRRETFNVSFPDLSYNWYGRLVSHTCSLMPWSRTDLLETVQDKAEAKLNPLNPVEWMKQMYKLINLLDVPYLVFGNSSAYNISSNQGIKTTKHLHYWSSPSSDSAFYTDTDTGTQLYFNAAQGATGLFADTLWAYANCGFIGGNWDDCVAQAWRWNMSVDGHTETNEWIRRQKGSATIALSGTGALETAAMEMQAKLLTIDRRGAYYYGPTDFNNELGAEGSMLTHSTSGVSGDSETFVLGEISDIPATGSTVSQYGLTYSESSWQINNYFTYDTEFEAEETWSTATGDMTPAWAFHQ
ncbi:MAG TPA: hypothetical protein DET40_21680 [Lentisphaeria bacterium]|nr:MAG: hypothetical protein A2X45_10960 [Lentisphaerae bacterium GWF2_50_93]HCE46164.1 hypothetical protein [Lentisphaeria bacterium]